MELKEFIKKINKGIIQRDQIKKDKFYLAVGSVGINFNYMIKSCNDGPYKIGYNGYINISAKIICSSSNNSSFKWIENNFYELDKNYYHILEECWKKNSLDPIFELKNLTTNQLIIKTL